MAYEKFAEVYDLLTENVNYEKRANYFENLIQKYRNEETGNILLDLGCGTGSLSEKFANKGYDVIGVDSSSDMLNIAIEKKFDKELDILYLNQSMTELNMFGTVDVVISALDTLNHLSSLDELDLTFEKVSLFLHPDGLFIFDLNTLYKHKNVLNNNSFVYDTDEAFVVWRNNLREDNSVTIQLDIFEKLNETEYDRYSEEFNEILFSDKDVLEVCKKNRLEIVEIFGEDSEEKPNDYTERLIYIVRKVN